MQTRFASTLAALAAVASLTSLAPITAGAAEYTQVTAAQSSIAFSYQQMGVKMDGQFKRFAAQLAFDPAKPASAKASFDVELASIDTGSADADAEVAGKPWFNTKAFPTARFVSSSVKPLGKDRYEVAGTLTIKGHSREIVVPASFSANGNAGAFDGSFTIRRGDFAIGEGSWSKFDIVANDVQIKFHIAASVSAPNGTRK
ncbi:MAG: YceI family protein [Rhodocyclaceae bacterium]